MFKRIKIILFSSCFFAAVSCNEQSQAIDTTVKSENKTKYPDLYATILEKDSLLFQVGFNQLDTNIMHALLANDFEFYHDVHGITESKQAFIQSIQGLKELSFKTWRTIRTESVEIYPLYSDQHTKLYGAIQIGEHDFYQQKKGEKAKKSGTARFNHLWILESGEWRLKRVLSYDHHD